MVRCINFIIGSFEEVDGVSCLSIFGYVVMARINHGSEIRRAMIRKQVEEETIQRCYRMALKDCRTIHHIREGLQKMPRKYKEATE